MRYRLTRWQETPSAAYGGSYGWTVFNLKGAKKFVKQAVAAQKQIARAAAGQRLSDYRKAEDISMFWTSSPNNETAYYKAAYWLAVVARLTGSWGLVAKAQWNAQKGGMLSFTPGSTLWTGGVADIYENAANAILGSVGVTAQTKPILAALGHHATKGSIAIAQETHYQQSPAATVVEPTLQTADDIARYLAALKKAAEDPTTVPWYYWAIGGTVALIVVLALLRSVGKSGVVIVKEGRQAVKEASKAAREATKRDKQAYEFLTGEKAR